MKVVELGEHVGDPVGDHVAEILIQHVPLSDVLDYAAHRASKRPVEYAPPVRTPADERPTKVQR